MSDPEICSDITKGSFGVSTYKFINKNKTYSNNLKFERKIQEDFG